MNFPVHLAAKMVNVDRIFLFVLQGLVCRVLYVIFWYIAAILLAMVSARWASVDKDYSGYSKIHSSATAAAVSLCEPPVREVWKRRIN
jgi:hypothetical protein